jgi:nitrogen regulatory protein PII
MKRIEIMANRSVQTEIQEGLETAIPDFYYTVLPVVHGRGRQRRRLGTPTWPEENFLLISYLDDANALRASQTIAGIKRAFPNEGIKIFTLSED